MLEVNVHEEPEVKVQTQRAKAKGSKERSEAWVRPEARGQRSEVKVQNKRVNSQRSRFKHQRPEVHTLEGRGQARGQEFSGQGFKHQRSVVRGQGSYT